MEKNDGGSAYPCAGSDHGYPVAGMSLRDYFAAEEKERAVSQMIEDTNILTGIMSDRRIMDGQLYDAGYRRFEIVER